MAPKQEKTLTDLISSGFAKTWKSQGIIKGNVSMADPLDMAGQRSGPISFPFAYTYPANTALDQVTYYAHDHLGNLRVAFTPVVDCSNPTGTEPDPGLNHPNSSFTLDQVVDYFPYGKILRQYVNSGGPERYLSTQHERDQETGLDYRGARYYDSDIGRFLSLDPLGGHEVQVDKSPYMYVWGNPVSNTDPDGRCPTCPGFGSEAAMSMASNPNGWGAYALGIGKGVVDHVQGTWNAITHPVQTAKTMMAMQQPGSPESIQAAMGMAMSANALVNGNGFERGQVIGGAAAGIVEGVALSKGAGAMMRAADLAGGATLSRAVGPAELSDIRTTGAFRNLGSAEGKYFTTSPEAASSYAKQAVQGFGDQPYNLVQSRVPQHIFNNLTPASVDNGIPAWVLPNKRLGGMTPQVMNSMPLPDIAP